MFTLLTKIFIKNNKNYKDNKVRSDYGTLASIFGIVSNFIICTMKFIVGLLFNIISITADAVNNLADASSSFVSLIGIKLSNKPADNDHPFGHARIEYIAGFLVSILIAALGLILIYSSIIDVINIATGKETISKMNNTEFFLTIGVLFVAILFKIYQAYVNYSVGKKINSTVLKATAIDSRNDVIATTVVLIGTVINQICSIEKVSLDGILGILVGLFIGYSGYKLIIETVDPLLGKAPEKEIVHQLSSKILSYDSILGIHDLQMHSYGPNCIFATCHVEIDSTIDVLISHDLIDNIEKDCLNELKIFTTIHMDPVVLNDPFQDELKIKVLNCLKEFSFPCSIHDFRIVKGPTHTNIVFDLLVPMNEKLSDNQIKNLIINRIKLIDESYYAYPTIDRDYTNHLISK
jgi:cation diffusion facilitator family transporter